MTDSELLRASGALLAALVETSNVFPFDAHAFGKAVRSLPGNAFAAKFFVPTRASGPYCPDFVHGLSLAQSAGLCFFESPEFRKVHIRFTAHSRTAKEHLTEDHARDVRELAKAYFQAVPSSYVST